MMTKERNERERTQKKREGGKEKVTHPHSHLSLPTPHQTHEDPLPKTQTVGRVGGHATPAVDAVALPSPLAAAPACTSAPGGQRTLPHGVGRLCERRMRRGKEKTWECKWEFGGDGKGIDGKEKQVKEKVKEKEREQEKEKEIEMGKKGKMKREMLGKEEKRWTRERDGEREKKRRRREGEDLHSIQ